jgi:hypothetical protein
VRKVAAAAGVHEFALLALFGKIDRGVARGFPARLIPYIVDRMLENVELRVREAVACNPQHIVSLDRAVGHDRAKLDGFVTYPLGR